MIIPAPPVLLCLALLALFCWPCVILQVREAYGKVGIPLLFDHTKVDERNPCILFCHINESDQQQHHLCVLKHFMLYWIV